MIIRLVLIWASVLICSLWIGNPSAVASTCTWRQTFNDSFDGTSLNTSVWNTTYGSGNNGEQQRYVPDAFQLGNGVLKIKAEKRNTDGYPYTSGIITTQDRFSQRYGYFKMRAKLSKGQGLWPAFWLLPASKTYPWEVDIFEMLGNDSKTLHFSNHWADVNGEHRKNTHSFTGADYSKGFHIFGFKWSRTEMVWYVDYVERYRTKQGVPSEPMFLLANFAVGGHWPGNPDASTPFPSYLQIDYIQVYEQVCH